MRLESYLECGVGSETIQAVIDASGATNETIAAAKSNPEILRNVEVEIDLRLGHEKALANIVEDGKGKLGKTGKAGYGREVKAATPESIGKIKGQLNREVI